jgi:hypothetical protein
MSNAQMANTQVALAGAAGLTDHDRALLNSVDSYLTAGLQLKQWWEQTSVTNTFAERFDLGLTFNRPDTGYGFFDHAQVRGQTIPVLGNFQAMFFDRPKVPSAQTVEAAQWMREQLREYVLRYFMHVSDFRQPQGTTEDERPIPPPYLRPFSLCPQEDPQRIGFGFSQLFYKLRDSGQIGRFPEAEQFAIVDLREIGQKYEWIVARVRIFDFHFTYMPFGIDNPQVVLPLSEASYLVLTRDFITHEDNPAPGVLGRYGLGYAFIKEPTSGLLAWGPGQFDAAIEIIDFLVLEDGSIRVEMAFVADRPKRILNLSLDPVNWSLTLADLMTFGLSSHFFAPLQGVLDQLPFRSSNVDPVYAFIWLANVLSGGQAAQQLCLSTEELDMQFLVTHFMQHYQTIAGALHTWRQIPDWLVGDDQLPQWVVKGVSS